MHSPALCAVENAGARQRPSVYRGGGRGKFRHGTAPNFLHVSSPVVASSASTVAERGDGSPSSPEAAA